MLQSTIFKQNYWDQLKNSPFPQCQCCCRDIGCEC